MPKRKIYQTTLNRREHQWIVDHRVTRLSDRQEVLIYPMGAERYLASILQKNKRHRYNIKSDIENKHVLVIPGYGNSAFLFAEAGAKSVTVYDKDPVTIAWVKAFKKYYHFREYSQEGTPYPSIGELLSALTAWYPPCLRLPKGKYVNPILWALNPKSLRRAYLLYMLSLTRHALLSKVNGTFELEKNIEFHVGELSDALKQKDHPDYDCAYVPYLLGVKNGIEKEEHIVEFMQQLTSLLPKGRILVCPSRSTKEFYFMGQRYFSTTHYSAIEKIPKLSCYHSETDKLWFKTQGLAVFTSG